METVLPRALRIGVTSVDSLLREVDEDFLQGHEVVEVGLAVLSPSGEYGPDRAGEVVAHFEHLGFSRLARDGRAHRWGAFGVVRWNFVRSSTEGQALSESEVISEMGEAWLRGEIVAVEKVGEAFRLIRPEPRMREAVFLEQRGVAQESDEVSEEIRRLMSGGTPRQIRILFGSQEDDHAVAGLASKELYANGYDELHGCESHAAEEWIGGYICCWVTQVEDVVESVSKSEAALCSLRLWTLGYSTGISFGMSHDLHVDESAPRLHGDKLTLETLRSGTIWVSESPED